MKSILMVITLSWNLSTYAQDEYCWHDDGICKHYFSLGDGAYKHAISEFNRGIEYVQSAERLSRQNSPASRRNMCKQLDWAFQLFQKSETWHNHSERCFLKAIELGVCSEGDELTAASNAEIAANEELRALKNKKAALSNYRRFCP